MNRSRLASSCAWRPKLCPAIDGSEPLVEVTGAAILAHHPEPQSAVGMMREAPAHNLRDKSAAEALAM